MQKNSLIKLFVISMSVPFLYSLLFLGIKHVFLLSVRPNWSDEVFYYKQIESMIAYGKPLGFYGYDGSHAPIGTYGAHGAIIMVPYALVQILSNNAFCGMAVTNHLLFGMALWYLGAEFHLNYQKLAMISLCYFAPLTAYYLNTDMVEGVSYATAIVAAGIIYRQYGKRNTSIFEFMFILFIPLCKITWLVLVPIYFFGVFDRRRALKSILVTILVGGVEYSVLKLTSSAYFSGVYGVEIIKNNLQNGVSGLIKYCRFDWIENIQKTFCFSRDMIGVAAIYVLVVILLSITYMVYGCVRRKRGCWIPSIVLLGYIFGITFFYSGGPAATRTVFQASMFSVVYMLLDYEWNGIRFLTCLCLAAFGVTIWMQAKAVYPYRDYQKSGDVETYKEYRNFTSKIEIDGNANPWQNTVAIDRTDFGSIYELFLPKGIGINYYWTLKNNLDSCKARYIMCRVREAELVDCIKDKGYEIVSENDEYYIFEKDKSN